MKETRYGSDRRNPDHDDRFLRLPQPNLAVSSEITPFAREWLWPARIPKSCLTLLVGDPGVGKSLLVADLAARISAGVPWPNDALFNPKPPIQNPKSPRLPPHTGSVLIVSREDAASSAILPRLIAAGAHLPRVAIVNGIYYPRVRSAFETATSPPPIREPNARPDEPIHLPDHIQTLQQAIRSIDNPRLVVLDPLYSLLSPGASSSPDHINRLLNDLSETARDHGVAILAIIHLTKASAPRTLYRVRGSLAFIAASRAAFLLSNDLVHRDRRVLSTLKSVYAPPAPPIAFQITPRDVTPLPLREGLGEGIRSDSGGIPEAGPARATENPFPEPIPAIQWLDPREATDLDKSLDPADLAPLPEELLDYDYSTRSALLEAREWLIQYLADGPQPVPEVLRAARSHGHASRTIERAKLKLGVRSIKQGNRQPWLWQMPALHAPPPQSSRSSEGEGRQPPAHTLAPLAPLASFGQNAPDSAYLENLSAEPPFTAAPEPAK